jgi:hypothetical protein
MFGRHLWEKAGSGLQFQPAKYAPIAFNEYLKANALSTQGMVSFTTVFAASHLPMLDTESG